MAAAEVVNAPIDPIEQLIDVKEVARRLGVSQDMVWKMVKAGTFIRPLELGYRRKWRVRDFNHFIEQRAVSIKAIEMAAGKSARSTRKRQ